MDSTRDYSSIIRSPSFTFLVGPKHTKLTIQSGLAQHVSKPLHNLMNNGHTRESKHRIAVLEDEDVETFVAFCEYAYTGDYRVPGPPTSRPECRKGIVESAPSTGNSWRETLRSDSVSSAVPPPAPSPPPECVETASQAAQAPFEPEPTPVIEEEVSAEAAAEAKTGAVENELPNEEPAEAGGNDPWNQPQDAAVSVTGTDEQVNPEPAEEPKEWGSWGAKTAEARKTRKLRREETKKKRMHRQVEEEPSTSLTPPTTPPLGNSLEADDVQPENTDNAPEAKAIEAEPVAEFEMPEAGPIEEPSAEPELALEDCEQPSTGPTGGVEELHEESWTEDDGDDQNGEEEAQETPKPIIDMSFAKQPDSSPRTPGLSLWDEFAALQYNDDRQTPMPTLDCSSPTDLPYLTFHAKVYVFATRYLIPALAQLCLRKLHRDLLQLAFEDADTMDPSLGTQPFGGLAARQAPMVLDLLRYAYTKTTRLEPISPTSATQLRENELRRLAVHYAACKVKALARYRSPGDSETATPAIQPVDAKVERAKDAAAPKSLRALLDMTPELASDLVYRMM